MGTNYYWKDNLAVVEGKLVEVDPLDEISSLHRHIGKMSSAGTYCTVCGTTLCLGGSEDIHHSRGVWLDECPSCGADASKAGQQGHPIQFCNSFTWTLFSHRAVMERLVEQGRASEKLIVDEYGKELSPEEFLAMVREIPYHYQYPREFR